MNASARNLLLANGATLAAALAFDWDSGWLLWPYWIQSVIIGWYARRRMLALRQFTTKGLSSNGRRVPEDAAGKRSVANFFAMHYGFFHLGYLVFLWQQHALAGSALDLLVLVACGVSFALSQRQTYAAQHAADLRGKPNLGTLMFMPYLRVVPMHVAIIAGGLLPDIGGVWLFVALKTAVDLALDAIDRKLALRSADKVAAAAELRTESQT